VSPHLIIIAGVFRKDLPKVLRVEHEQMVRALAPDRADQAFNISVLPRRAERGGPVPDPHCSDAVKDARATTIEPNEQSTIGPTQMRSAWRSLLQDIELMPQYHALGFQLLSRLEAVAQHADEQEADCNHAAIMF